MITSDTENMKNLIQQGKDKGLFVGTSEAGEVIKVTNQADAPGYCFDYFNSQTVDFVKNYFKTNMYLPRNSPYFKSYEVETTPKFIADAYKDPYQGLPFYPGSQNLFYKSTLPPFAQHKVGTNVDYHFNLHGLFGS